MKPAKIVLFLASLLAIAALSAADWPRFRGANGSGVADESNLPVEFGPNKNVVWKTPIPAGHSSPSIAGDKIFLTAFENDRLFTLALDRATGRILWRREVQRPRRQELHANNNPASSTPVSDGRNVYVFFGDYGMLAYGPDGNELWRMPLGPFDNPFGPGSSPILAGDKLLILADQDTGSYLLALDKNTGRELWRTERPYVQRGYTTPVLFQPANGKPQIVASGSYQVTGYDIDTGRELWAIRGLPWIVKPSPTLDGDTLYFAAVAGESAPGNQVRLPPFTEALAAHDANKDRKIARSEADPEVARRWSALDLDRSGFLEQRDWELYQSRGISESNLRAYKLGGTGDLTESALLWKSIKAVPNVSSPVAYQGILYTLKEGGIFSSYDAKTGELFKQARLSGALGDYYSSPIAADGKLYMISEEGKATVIQAGKQWEVLTVNDMEEGGCHATPAIADGRIYLRTATALYSFSKAR